MDFGGKTLSQEEKDASTVCDKKRSVNTTKIQEDDDIENNRI